VPDIQTERLSISFRDTGPRHSKAALLLHGWPDDRSTWDGVAEKLNWSGIRTIMPNLRGFGGTRFLSDDLERTGNSAVLSMDAIALMDALGIEEFSVAGHDWGAGIAEALAVGWPDRISSIAMLSTSPQMGDALIPAENPIERPTERHARPEWWSRWFHPKGRGTEPARKDHVRKASKSFAQAMRKDRKGFALTLWKNWSPPGWFDDETFEQVARSFENPDWVDVTLHAYRARWGEAPPDARSIWLEERVKEARRLSLPALVFQGAKDGVIRPDGAQKIMEKFDGPFAYVVLPDVGHFPTREAPDMVGELLTEHFGGC
jgi:pimeloyl-ACP methyl ester carboxylesterase